MESGMLTQELRNIEKIRRDLDAQAVRIIAEIQEKILDYNREGQLFEKGIDSTGSLLKPYSPYTVALKKQKGEVYNRTTLLDAEDFYKGFFLTAKDGLFEIDSSDNKTDDLTAKYGKNIFGLTTDNEGKINEEIYEKLLEWIIQNL